MAVPIPITNDPDDILEISPEIEQRLARLEATIGAFDRVEDKIDKLADSLSGVGILEARQLDHRTSMNAFGKRIDDTNIKVDAQGKAFISQLGMFRGVAITATVLWFVFGGALTTLVTKLYDKTETNHTIISQVQHTQARITNGIIDSRFVFPDSPKTRRHGQPVPSQ